MVHPNPNASAPQKSVQFPFSALLLASVVFIVYGSLVPLEFQALPPGKISQHFLGLGQSGLTPRSLTDWTTNIAIFMPLGFFGLAALGRGDGLARLAWNILLVLAGGLLLSTGIEFTQVFFPPRDSSVLDVMANTLGTALGIVVGIVSGLIPGNAGLEAYRALVKKHVIPRTASLPGKWGAAALLGCGLLIAGWAGFFTTGWTGGAAAIAHLEGVRALPFLQHQAAAIGLAVISTLLAALVYAPLGTVLWLRGISNATSLRGRLMSTILLAASLALLVEAAKLFLVARNPDTGNVVIAGLAAGLGYFIAPLVAGLPIRDGVHAEASKPLMGLLVGRTFALVCAIAAGALVAAYPMGRIQLGIALLAYAVILMRYPMAWLIVVPALLPVLDLAPWTGRFFIDEFDGLVLVTLTVGLWRFAGRPLAASPGPMFWLLVGLFAMSYLISSAIGLLPLQPLDASALSSHYSHFAALRLAKGLLLAIGLAVMLSHQVAAGHDVKRALGAGMILGLAAASGSVIWERLAYAGLFDFTKGFRVVGLFSTMNTGGAHLDAYLIATLPFAAGWALVSRRPAVRVAATLVFAMGAYAVMMTFSRAAVAALVVEVLAIAAWALLSGRQSAWRRIGLGARVMTGLGIAALIVAPALLGSFMQSRLAMTDADLDIRTSHWNDAAAIMTDNWSTSLFGMGLGRYPETYQILSPGKTKPAVHRFETEGNNTFLRIHHGAPLYVEQIVSVEPRRDYKLVLRARTLSRNASVNVLLCDRTFLGGFGCQSATFQLSGEAGKWQQFQATLNSASVGENRLRTAKLSLENARPDTDVDIDDVALTDSGGADQLANGSFQAGADRWFSSSPFNHLPWHIKNLWLEVFFEQGWLGLLAFCAVITATVARLGQLAWQGKALAAVLLASVMGFLAVGAFDSMFDAPRLTLLFGLLVAATGIVYARPQTIATPVVATGTTVEPDVSAWQAGNEAPPPFEWRRTAMNVLVGILMLAAAIAVVTRMPFVPYNIRELPNPHHPLIAPILLAIFVFWVFGMPAVAARWLTLAKNRGVAFPLLVACHGLIGWMVLQFAVLPESIHDVIGSPVLHWPWQTEYIARFLPLLSVLSVQLAGGALIAAAITGYRVGAAPVWWLVSAAVLFPVQYWVIVTQAATDNLRELVAANASVGACLLLSSYLVLVGVAGSLLASLRTGTSPGRTFVALAVLVISLPLGYLLLDAGTEAVINYEQKVFSALQFLLSTDRAHYAVGPELWLRYAALHLAAVGMTALTQYALWTGFHARSLRQRRRKMT